MSSNMDVRIFRKNDIRGIASGDKAQINPISAEIIGRSAGTFLQQNYQTERIFVGSDNRISSLPIKNAFIRGVVSTGLNTIDVGYALTPMIYFLSAYSGEKTAGAVITGSHLPTEFNGIKIVHGNFALSSEEIQHLLEIIQYNKFIGSLNGRSVFDSKYLKLYFNYLKNQVKIYNSISVVIDAGNALSGSFIPPFFESLGIKVHRLYCELDGTYPNHLPNPEITDNMKDLGREVRLVNADVGIAFDGDADRCGLVDNKGNHIPSDLLVVPLAQDFLSRNPHAQIVIDIKTSDVVSNIINLYGGKPVIWKTGHTLTMLKMKEIGAQLGSDAHGHLYFGENYFGFDDAPLAALKLLEIFARSDRTVEEIFATIPEMFTTPEIILQIPDDIKMELVESVKGKLQTKYKIIDIDGAKALLEDGWGLIRISNSQPAITLRFEAHNQRNLIHNILIFKEILDQFDKINTEALSLYVEKIDYDKII